MSNFRRNEINNTFARTLDVSEEDAEEIRHARDWDGREYKWLAEQYDLPQTTVRYICKGYYYIDNGKVVLTKAE
jgi:hypothetical protein